ncbi:MAG: ATP-binding cassette domain-containing protein [Candidatus Paralactobacillus gallistercoris]|uniref:ATP-binding cassette domain-containing protein n=1 Tax=Candidatus Paralactobacillus gallistercoris TaxID=2838724 RepID=A0A948TIZ1_9LACO|nr:ATP-binding cassette domain-containing protein [Candidatus Paralactobacillus gallistercoris]
MVPIIQTTSITYQDEAGNNILKDINLHVLPGQCLTITGPSGAGKSTLLKIIASLLTPTAGQVLFNGKDINHINSITYRQQVSYCYQQPSLFGKTVADNLYYPYQIRNQQPDITKLKQQLAQMRLPSTFLSKDINTLSGGEKQRVALIRNLLFNPQVLLLDEITSGLDSVSKQIVLHHIATMQQKGSTIIKITHDEQQITAAQHIIYIKDGQINESQC